MKTKRLLQLFFSILVCLFYGNLRAQVVTIDYILEGPVKEVKAVKLPKEKVFILQSDYGEYKLNNPALIDSIRGRIIDRIELVYTDYTGSKSFSQPALNYKRLAYLQEKIPHLFNNNLIDWQIVCQTGAKTSEEAKSYFHGFIVYLKELNGGFDIKSTAEELDYIKKICDSCLAHVGDTVRSRSSLYSSSTPGLRPIVVKKDTLIRVPQGKHKGFFMKVNPSAIKSRDFFEKKNAYKYIADKSPGVYEEIPLFTAYGKTKKNKEEGSFVPRSARKRKAGIIYHKKTILNRKPLYKKEKIPDTAYVKVDTMFVITSISAPVMRVECMGGLIKSTFQSDTIVLKTMSRLKEREKYMVVEDVTGSMYPYLTQTFLWRRTTMASGTLSHFIFFNDGDRKGEHQKKPGETGGIYTIDTTGIEAIEALAKHAMSQGNGGDCPENNLEALILAKKMYPDLRLLMIADNNAPIKDLILLDQIKWPVDVILCGVQNKRIQADYMTLVKTVGGTIYTMDEELSLLSELKEAETTILGGQKFKLLKGRFVLTL